MTNLPAKLQEIVTDFSLCVGPEKLEYLLEFAESLPPLPAAYQGGHDSRDQVHECMSPVFVYVEKQDGRICYHFDVPPEAPTVRGFAAILKKGLDGETKSTIQSIPNEFYLAMGLQQVISGQRLNGLGAILRYMKTLAG